MNQTGIFSKPVVKRTLAFALTLALVAGLLPRLFPQATASTEGLSNLNTEGIGQYIPCQIVKDKPYYIINAGVGDLPEHTPFGRTIINVNGKVERESNALLMEEDVDKYNAMKLFSPVNCGSSGGGPPGFSTWYSKGHKKAGGRMLVNYGSTSDDANGGVPISLGMAKTDQMYGHSYARIEIAQIPNLKAIAELGRLEYRFTCLVCGAKEDITAWPDDHNIAEAWLYQNSTQIDHAKTSTSNHTSYLSTYGWRSIGPNDTISFDVNIWEDGGSAESASGLGYVGLFFRDVGKPTVSVSMDAKADYHPKSGDNKNEILFNQDSELNVTFQFSEPVVPMFGTIAKSVSNLTTVTDEKTHVYQLFDQLANHKLFQNPNDTGYRAQGEWTYLAISKVDDTEISASAAKVERLQQPFSKLQYFWSGADSPGTYSGNKPVPGGGDWLLDSLYEENYGEKVPLNNTYGLWNKIVLASLHDLAGNPIYQGSQPYAIAKDPNDATGATGTHRDKAVTVFVPKCSLTVGRTTKTNLTTDDGYDFDNPFAEYDFIMDAVPPTFSMTSNGIQPDVLTGLALNKGDSFFMTLNFSEGVQTRWYYEDGALTGMFASKTKVEFAPAPEKTDAISASYVKGDGTQSWQFEVTIPGGSQYDVATLDVSRFTNPGNKYSSQSVVTDYVGNPLTDYSISHPKAGDSGSGRKIPSIAWAQLKIDNTLPNPIQIEKSGGEYTITATDPTVNGSASGIFAPVNMTSGEPDDKSQISYVWVKEDDYEHAVATLTANNFALVKRASLAGNRGTEEYQVLSANNGVAVKPPTDDGQWVLLAFAADKTWDAARQITQYAEFKNMTTNEEKCGDYYQLILQQFGVSETQSASQVEYKLTTSKPGSDDTDDPDKYWETYYSAFFTSPDGGKTFKSVPQNDSYPDWDTTKDRYYKRGFIKLTSDPSGGNWKNVYESYYVSDGNGGYVLAPHQNEWPDFETNKYYTKYTPVTDDSAPSDWTTAQFYQKNGSGVPEWEKDMYYTLSGGTYTLQTSQPSDWTSNYEKYYVKYDDNSSYVSLWDVVYAKVNTSGVPDFEGEIYGALTKVTVTETKETKVVDDTTNPPTTEEVITYTPTEDEIKSGDYYVAYDGLDGAYRKATNRNGTLATAFKTGAVYYKRGTKQSSKPSNWDSKYASYYEATPETYVSVEVSNDTVPTWTANTYFEKKSDGTYSLLSSKPSDWDKKTDEEYDCTKYYTWLPALLRPVKGPTPVEYAKDTYFRKSDSYTALTAAPAAWETEYQDYFTKSGDNYVHIPEKKILFTDNTFYASGYLRVKSQPAEWRTVSIAGEYYFFTGPASELKDEMTSGQFENLSNLPKRQTGVYPFNNNVTFRLHSAPDWTANTYWEASLSTAVLENLLKKDPDRLNLFKQKMIAAQTNVARIEAINSFPEFAPYVTKANRIALQQSGKYEDWPIERFQQNDSNWVYGPVSRNDSNYQLIDKTPPVIEMVEGSLTGNNTDEATVQVKISDNNKVSVAKYAFVQAGQPVNDSAWLVMSESDFTSMTCTFSTQEYAAARGDSLGLDMSRGDFDLYVWAEDPNENSEYENICTVTLDSGLSLSYELLWLDGSKETVIKASGGVSEVNMTTVAYMEVPLAVRFGGKVDGVNLFDSSLKFTVQALINDSASAPSGSAAWTTVSGASDASSLGGYPSYRYVLPTVGAEDGQQTTKYLHLRYSYTKNGATTTTDVLEKGFLLNTVKPDVAFNLMHSGTTYATVQVTATIPEGTTGTAKYQWLAGRKNAVPDGSDGAWTSVTLPETLTVNADDAVSKSGKGVVTLAVRVTNNLGNEVTKFFTCMMSAESAVETVAPPAPTMSLLGVQESGGTYYAVVKLTLSSEPEEGAEYSWALVSGGEEPVWSRWIPYESMVRVEIGQDLSKTLKFKFRSSSGDATKEPDYLSVGYGASEPFSVGVTAPWAVVTRSSFQPVKAEKGLTLRFIKSEGATVLKDGASVETDTVRSNGVYSYTVRKDGETDQTLYVAVNNVREVSGINWALSFSETEETATPVLATLTIEEGVHVEEISFRKPGSLTSTQAAPGTSYLFTENGTATFLMVDQFGDRETATATVNWLDTTPPALMITPTYTNFSRITDSKGNVIATGAALILTGSERIRVTSADAQFVDSSQEDSYASSFTFGIWENGSYAFTAQDALGNTTTKSIEVSNLISSIPEPEVSVRLSDRKDKALVVVQGTVANPAKALGKNYKLYDGKSSTDGEAVSVENGVYTIIRTYTENRSVTGYVTDFLGNTVSYTAAISGIDSFAPSILVTGSPVVEQGSDPNAIDWRRYVKLSDDATPEEDIELTVRRDNGKPIQTDVSGTYRMLLNAVDFSGNVSKTASLYLYVLPSSGIVVTDENGVLFYAASKDIAFVADDQIELSVSQYQLMDYFDNGKTETVTNAAQTYDIYIQKGLFREGQLKYIQTVTFRDQGGENEPVSTVTITPQQLDGPGWYTIIVRNSERAREFTTFFINTTKLKKTS